MTPEQFVYWMNGFVETNGGKEPTPDQWVIIKDHLATVCKKITQHKTMPASNSGETNFC